MTTQNYRAKCSEGQKWDTIKVKTKECNLDCGFRGHFHENIKLELRYE